MIPIVDEYISPTIFFDFAEMMAEDTKYIVSDIKFNNSGIPRITITYSNTQGVEKEQAEELIPYEKVRKAYENAEYYDCHKEHLMKGEGTIWDTYNSLTRFATHTSIWKHQDYRRINIMNGAVSLLKKKPDIVNYIDIY